MAAVHQSNIPVLMSEDRPEGEKRRMDRFLLATPATLEVAVPAGAKRTLNLVTRNISAGGAFFTSRDPVPEGSKVALQLILTIEQLKSFFGYSGKVEVSLRGSVVRVSNEGMAVQFGKNYQMRSLGEGLRSG
jgi:hypothetical protein